MAARDRVKTMVPRARSTLDGPPEVKQRRAIQVFPLLANTKTQATSFVAYNRTTRPTGCTYVHTYVTGWSRLGM